VFSLAPIDRGCAHEPVTITGEIDERMNTNTIAL